MNKLTFQNTFERVSITYPSAFIKFWLYVTELQPQNEVVMSREAGGISWPFIDDLHFGMQVGLIMAWIESVVKDGQLGKCPAAFLLQDGFNVAGVKQNLIRIFARIENNLL